MRSYKTVLFKFKKKRIRVFKIQGNEFVTTDSWLLLVYSTDLDTHTHIFFISKPRTNIFGSEKNIEKSELMFSFKQRSFPMLGSRIFLNVFFYTFVLSTQTNRKVKIQIHTNVCDIFEKTILFLFDIFNFAQSIRFNQFHFEIVFLFDNDCVCILKFYIFYNLYFIMVEWNETKYKYKKKSIHRTHIKTTNNKSLSLSIRCLKTSTGYWIRR